MNGASTACDDMNLQSEGLKITLNRISELKLCQGVQDSDLQRFADFPKVDCKYFREVQKGSFSSTVRNVACQVVAVKAGMCASCQNVRKCLIAKKLRDKVQSFRHSKSRLRHAVKIQRVKIKNLQTDLANIRKKLKDADVTVSDPLHASLAQLCEETVKGNDFLQLFWAEQKKMFSTAKTGMAMYFIAYLQCSTRSKTRFAFVSFPTF